MNKTDTYIVDDKVINTISWLLAHEDCYESFPYDVIEKKLVVYHANGSDVIHEGDYLNASYGLLITAHNFAK